jgi:hypothetical protein
MDYRAALMKTNCAVTQPVVKPKVVHNCMACSKVKLTKAGVCKCCNTQGYAISKCGICNDVKLTFQNYCMECLEEEEKEEEDDESESDYDPDECRVCRDTDKIYGRCLTCLKADERDERERCY